MGRGPKPTKGHAKPAVPRKSRKKEDSKVRDLEKRLAEALKLHTEAQEQQTATSEILRVISSSPSDLQPVLDAVVQRAARLCDATDALIFSLQGEQLELVAKCGEIRVPTEALPLTRGLVTSRAVIDRRTLHVEDLAAELDEYRDAAPYVRGFGHRTILVTPLLREGLAIGAIAIRRTEVRPFSNTQVDLLKTFADQAVIAIENVRLFTEPKQALERQTATAEILRVIAGSPTEYQPVFETIVRTAGVVCGAVDAMLWTIDGDELVVRAHHGPLAAAIGARQPVLGSVAGYAVRQARVVHVDDLTDADDFPVGRDTDSRLGWRTTVSAPLDRKSVV